jgi:phosphoenolpyruvate-protein kinase (PTS system EI component)
VDFISIGTNDLTQYTLAAERRNAGVAALSDPLDLGVLRLIRHVCHTAGGTVPVAVCGEAAADHTAIPVLIGLGVRELSVSPKSVPSVKARARTLDLARCALSPMPPSTSTTPPRSGDSPHPHSTATTKLTPVLAASAEH